MRRLTIGAAFVLAWLALSEPVEKYFGAVYNV